MFTERSGRVDRPHGAVVIPLVTALVVALLAVGAYQTGRLNRYICDGPCGAKYVQPPKELGLVVARTPLAPDLSRASAPDAAKVKAAVSGALKQSALGGSVGFVALNLDTGATLTASGGRAMTPASTTKVLTAFAALSVIDSQTRFATTVVSGTPGSIVLVGGGDPYLDLTRPARTEYAHQANLTDLAAQTAAALKKAGTTSVSLGYDESLFGGPDVSPTWPGTYLSQNVVTPISALWVSQGVGGNGIRTRTPAKSAADAFATLLRNKGIAVKGAVSPVKASASATGLAKVQSGTVAQILESAIQFSDNQAAEVMLRHLAIAKGKAGTFLAGVDVARGILGSAGIDTSGLALFDGSGLSRNDLIAPLTLAQTIRVAATRPSTVSLISDLPTGGFNGSISQRFLDPKAKAALGVVHAKTGTLTGVNSLAGIVQDLDGRPIVFAVMADQTKGVVPLAAKAALDNVVAALAGCHCGP